MRLSKYTSFVPDYPEPGQHLTCNFMTQAMAVLDNDVRGIIDSPEPFDAAHLPPDLAHQLDEMGMVVADDVDERVEVERWHRRVMQHARTTFKAMVLTTYDCNFACTYCVEDGVKEPVKLEDEVADATVRWIIDRMEEQGSERLYLNFYGGEPLLNMAGLERVAAPLQAYTRERGWEFDGSVTTNGALLNRERAQRLARVGIGWAKVTLDGDREAHDVKRPFKGGHGSFDLIVQNLEEVWDLIEVRITGNLDGQNIDAAPRLLDYLQTRGLDQRLGGIHFSSISEPTHEGFSHCGQDLLEVEPVAAQEGETSSSTHGDTAAAILEADRQVVQRGLPTRRAIAANLCLLNQGDHAVVIDPLGKIFKCPTLVGHEAFIVGDVSQAELRLEDLRIYDEDREDCLDCNWFPVCAGGCRFASFLQTGDIRRRNCTRDYLDEHSDEMIKMDYEICLQE